MLDVAEQTWQMQGTTRLAQGGLQGRQGFVLSGQAASTGQALGMDGHGRASVDDLGWVDPEGPDVERGEDNPDTGPNAWAMPK
jgi:hypothetical protein